MQSVSQHENVVKVHDSNSPIDASACIRLAKDLSWQDRRILLGANLRLLSHRLRHGFPVLTGDISRMVGLADDADHKTRVAA
jgi:hypothetical protein